MSNNKQQQIWENFQRQGFSSNGFQQNFQAQFFNNLGNFPPISSVVGGGAQNQQNKGLQQQQQQMQQQPQSSLDSKMMKNQPGGSAQQQQTVGNPLLQQDYDGAFSNQAQYLNVSQQNNGFYSEEAFPSLGGNTGNGNLGGNNNKFGGGMSYQMESEYQQQRLMSPGGASIFDSSHSDSLFMDVYAVYGSYASNSLLQGGTSALIHGGLDTGVDTNRLLPTDASENVSVRLIKPFSRYSAMLDQPQLNEKVNFENDCLEPAIQFPESLKLNKQFEVSPQFLKRVPDKVLFYIFYNMPFDKQQIDAAKELESRGWKYTEMSMRWYRKEVPSSSVKGSKQSQSSINNQGATQMFDPDRWDIISSYS